MWRVLFFIKSFCEFLCRNAKLREHRKKFSSIWSLLPEKTFHGRFLSGHVNYIEPHWTRYWWMKQKTFNASKGTWWFTYCSCNANKIRALMAQLVYRYWVMMSELVYSHFSYVYTKLNQVLAVSWIILATNFNLFSVITSKLGMLLIYEEIHICINSINLV